MDVEKFKKDMGVFSFKQHQDVLTYLGHLEANGWTIEDARDWVQGEKDRMQKQSEHSNNQRKKAYEPLPRCPECQSPVWLLPVNTGPGDQTGDDSKSMMLCSNKECMHTIYSEKTVQEQAKELTKK